VKAGGIVGGRIVGRQPPGGADQGGGAAGATCNDALPPLTDWGKAWNAQPLLKNARDGGTQGHTRECAARRGAWRRGREVQPAGGGNVGSAPE